jgi:hypothetical protein
MGLFSRQCGSFDRFMPGLGGEGSQIRDSAPAEQRDASSATIAHFQTVNELIAAVAS